MKLTPRPAPHAPPLLLILALALALGACPQRRAARPDEGGAPRPPAKKAQRPPDIPESGPLAQKILYEQAKGLLQTGKAAQAVELFRRAIDAHPRGDLLPSCYLALGSAYGDLGRHAEALEAYRKVVTLRPDDPEGFRALAIGQEEAGKLGEARASLEHAISLNPDQPSAYQDLANLWLREKNVEEAKKVYLRYELTRTRLILALAKNKDEEQRAAAAAALGEAKDEATARALGLALTDRSKKVRLAVIHALGQQGLASGAGPLRELLGRTTDPAEKRQIEASLRAISLAPQPTSQPATRPVAPPAPPPGAPAKAAPPAKK